MYQFIPVLFAVSTALGVLVGTGHASSAFRDALGERFKLSRIEGQNPSGEGHVIKKGTVLVLQADGIPANPLRFVQLNTKSPRFHVADYARVEVGREGRLTHTLEPQRMPDRKGAYGCAEFVFDPATLDRADVATVAGRINQWLSVNSAS